MDSPLDDVAVTLIVPSCAAIVSLEDIPIIRPNKIINNTFFIFNPFPIYYVE
jgi:hypothetical protein